jgi:hypothetical protein
MTTPVHPLVVNLAWLVHSLVVAPAAGEPALRLAPGLLPASLRPSGSGTWGGRPQAGVGCLDLTGPLREQAGGAPIFYESMVM